MCGICGVIQLGGDLRVPLDEATLDAMTDRMVHRGPDERGTYLAPGVALGVRRLAIVDVEGGHQPVSSEDGRVLAIQNGELYNHLDLRERLGPSHRYRSRCDTEVLPHLYERFGARFPAELRGKFAICVWDAADRTAVLARDRIGVKPLYYAHVGDRLLFASELKSLLASGLVTPTLDKEAIASFLTLGFVPGPMTPLAQVRKLMPGEALIASPEGARFERYWRYPAPDTQPQRMSEIAHAERLIELLEESVRLRLMSDVPLGAMLSGGLDSSLIVALMARNMSKPVKTFSVGFREAGPYNELGAARAVARHFGTEHHELELSFSDTSVDLVDLVWALDEPLADLSALGFLALSELASRHVTVALSGQGADELFGGYPRHRSARRLRQWDRIPAPFKLATTRLLRMSDGAARRRQILMTRDAVSRYLAQQELMDGRTRARILKGDLAAANGGPGYAAIAQHLSPETLPSVEATLFLDAALGLVDDMLLYFDRASMAHSLEVRVPFLDHQLVEAAAAVPATLKVSRDETKRVLKVAARGLVPDRVIDSPKVGFFNAAVAPWFEAQMETAVRHYLRAPEPHYAEFLEREEVERLIHQGTSGTAQQSRLLLAILMLEIWLSSFLPRAMPERLDAQRRVPTSGSARPTAPPM